MLPKVHIVAKTDEGNSTFTYHQLRHFLYILTGKNCRWLLDRSRVVPLGRSACKSGHRKCKLGVPPNHLLVLLTISFTGTSSSCRSERSSVSSSSLSLRELVLLGDILEEKIGFNARQEWQYILGERKAPLLCRGLSSFPPVLLGGQGNQPGESPGRRRPPKTKATGKRTKKDAPGGFCGVGGPLSTESDQ